MTALRGRVAKKSGCSEQVSNCPVVSSESAKKRSHISLLSRSELSLLGRALRAVTILWGFNLAFRTHIHAFARISNKPACVAGVSSDFLASVIDAYGSILWSRATGWLHQSLCCVIDQPNIFGFHDTISTKYRIRMTLLGGQALIFEPSKVSLCRKRCKRLLIYQLEVNC